jgi:hypothetical protein
MSVDTSLTLIAAPPSLSLLLSLLLSHHSHTTLVSATTARGLDSSAPSHSQSPIYDICIPTEYSIAFFIALSTSQWTNTYKHESFHL